MDVPETQFAPGPEGQVGYQIFGEGKIDVLFVPPWAWNIDAMWDQPRIEGFFRRLSSFCRVAIFDKRGTGISDQVPLGALPSIESWTDDIGVALEHIKWERPAIIAANESSFMGLLFAASHPERVASLTILDGAPCVPQKDDYPPGLPTHLFDKAMEWFRARDFVPMMGPSAADDQEFRRWFARFLRLAISPTFLERLIPSTMQWDVRSALPTITVPTLIIHRANQRYYLVGHARYMAEHIARATYVELPGNDHMFYVGNQDEILHEIRGFLTGVRDEPDVDRILATVLFTDIVASTDHAARLGDRRWGEALDAHDRLVQRYIDHFRGRRIKTTGDGVLATFDGPARAIRCARAIEDDVRRDLGIEVRAGLHTGEVELRDDDIGGIAVALAARVMSLAQPSEVLVSSTVKDLVVGSGIDFEERGAQSLKGIPGEWRLFSAR